ncbi:PTS fructose transporter subunit IIA [Coriobacteriales bacterium OH1046]|nr:PTS fructose transporter subunit IIA [Coriobacteriales bacterium OH1046]
MDPSEVLKDASSALNKIAALCGEPIVETLREAAEVEAAAEERVSAAVAPKPVAATAAVGSGEKPRLFANFGKDLVKAFNTGVSYFIPVVVIGGVFLAFALASGRAGESGMEVTNPIMQSLNTIGMAGISMMIPVLAAYIAYSIAGKPALAPGFVLGYLANNAVSTPILNAAGEATSVSTGFLGAMLLGVCAGYLVNWMKTWKVNDTIRTIMPILIIPLLSTLVLGMVYIYVLAYPIGMFMNWLTDLLSDLSGGSAIVLGLVIGVMTAIDMGGPINKTASTFTMAMMTVGVYGPNGAFRVAVAIPPLACGLAALIAKSKFDAADRQMGISAIFMGLIGITEGAIPFAVKDFPRIAPGICIGSAIGAALAMVQNIECYVPHGGMIVALATNNIALYALDMLVGTLVAAAIIIAMKPKMENA